MICLGSSVFINLLDENRELERAFRYQQSFKKIYGLFALIKPRLNNPKHVGITQAWIVQMLCASRLSKHFILIILVQYPSLHVFTSVWL